MSAPLNLHTLQALYPGAISEHKFLGDRKFRFDFAWPKHKIALEYEGGNYSKIRKTGHLSVSGYEKDCYKYSRAAIDGWIVIRSTAKMWTQQVTITLLDMAFKERQTW